MSLISLPFPEHNLILFPPVVSLPPDHDDLWGLDPADKVDNLTHAFWERYPSSKGSVLRAMVGVVR